MTNQQSVKTQNNNRGLIITIFIFQLVLAVILLFVVVYLVDISSKVVYIPDINLRQNNQVTSSDLGDIERKINSLESTLDIIERQTSRY